MTAAPFSTVYLALGAGRIEAARWYASDLAAAGNRVLLVVPDSAAWTNAELPDEVTVHRLRATEPAAARRAAGRLLFRRRGPLSGAALLVAGDAESTPLADRARRRFPQLTVRLEPASAPDRRPAPTDLAVVTPSYPSPNDPGAAAAIPAEAVVADRVAVLHIEAWTHAPHGLAGRVQDVTLEREIASTGGVVVEDRPEGELTRVVTPHRAGDNCAVRAQAGVDRLRAVLPGGRIEAPLVHAYTGLYGGVAAAALARDDARIVVTEPATDLAEVFGLRAARLLYRQMLARVDRVECADPEVRAQIVAQFPDLAGKVQSGETSSADRVAVRPPAPRTPVTAPAPGADRVVVVAIDPVKDHRVGRYVDGARAKGYAVDLIALDPAKWRGRYDGDDGVRIFDIGAPEQRRFPRRLQRGLVTQLPRQALGFARARARTMRSPVPEAVTIHAQRRHHSLARAFDGRIYGPWYELIRPRILWRITRRAVVPALDLARTRAVVVHGVPGVTTGWNLARRYPDMVIKTDLTPPAEDANVRP
jgi:hypothetical protein